MRTYDPFVYSPGEKWRVFSGGVSSLAALRACESCARERKLMLLRSAFGGVFLAYFSFYNGKCVLVFAAEVTAALGHVKDCRSPSCAAFGRLGASPAVLAFRGCR